MPQKKNTEVSFVTPGIEKVEVILFLPPCKAPCQLTHIHKCVVTRFCVELVELTVTNIPVFGTDCGAGWEGTLRITER